MLERGSKRAQSRRPGQRVMTIADPSQDWELELAMPERRMGHVRRAVDEFGPNLDVSYISAGHTDQIYYRNNTKELLRIRNKNPIIGTFRNAKFTSDTIMAEPGDVIVMYSDGIVEGTNPEGEQLGKERLDELFMRVGNEGDATAIIGRMLLQLEDFFEGTIQKDDRTLMVIKL